MPNRKPCFEGKGSLSRSRGIQSTCNLLPSAMEAQPTLASLRGQASDSCHRQAPLPPRPPTQCLHPCRTLAARLTPRGQPSPRRMLTHGRVCVPQLAGAHSRKAELAARRATAFRRLRARTARPQVSVRLEVSSPNRAQPCRCAPSVCCAATSTLCRLRPAHMLLRRWLQEAGTRRFRSKIKSGRKTGFSGAFAAPID